MHNRAVETIYVSNARNFINEGVYLSDIFDSDDSFVYEAGF